MKTTLRQLLFRPVIFVSFVLGLLVLGELLAITRLTWINRQRIHTIERDIDRSRYLEKTIFELMQLQLHLSSRRGGDQSQQRDIATIQAQLIEILNSKNTPYSTNSIDLENLRSVFSKAPPQDQPSMLHALELIEQIQDKQATEEERLLINVKYDSYFELLLAIILPLLLILVGRYFFKTNVLEPLNSLKELLTGLADGHMTPIEHNSNDQTMDALFERYNLLVSRLVELEQEHLEHTNALESRVRQTSHALLEQSQQLAKAQRLAALTELAASTAHELRNPLASIQLALENMLQECEDAELSKRMHMVYREVQRLTRNLNDLLASARTGFEAAQKINLRHLLEELLMLLKYQSQEHISFEYRVPNNLQVMLPESEFRQMLLNLLLNSIQAIGPGKGRIEIEAYAEKDKLLMQITDSGPGFSAEMLQNGIRPFVSWKEGGTGLGLAMAQRFVRDRQGQLQILNTADGHARVTFSLPIN